MAKWEENQVFHDIAKLFHRRVPSLNRERMPYIRILFERATERAHPSADSPPQMVTMPRIKRAQPEPGACFRSPMGVAGAKVLGPSSTALPGPLAGSWVERGAAGSGTSTNMGCRHWKWQLHTWYPSTGTRACFNSSALKTHQCSPHPTQRGCDGQQCSLTSPVLGFIWKDLRGL